ncbi:hypothetical protein Goarm_004017, partial [Gossypium armourianum]|nr:hypothetical protein [Gossypium armourianum]
ELLHTKERQGETILHLKTALGDILESCEIESAGEEITACSQGTSFLPSAITEDMFSLELPARHPGGLLASDPISVTVDNSLSPSHTLIQILCQDHKGLIYDSMRTLKDYNIQEVLNVHKELFRNCKRLQNYAAWLLFLIARFPIYAPYKINILYQVSYGRFFANRRGGCELDLFIVQADGKKIIDRNKQNALCSRLRMELFRPLRVAVVSRGPDTELLVANPVELSGRGRPLVFHDITLALKNLNIQIFSVLPTLSIIIVEIGRHMICDREWEVYRILLDEGDSHHVSRNMIEE